MNKGARALWFFTLLLLLVGIAGVIASVIGDSWWEYNSTREGLWRNCTSGKCKSRKGTLKFEEDYRDHDAILLVLIISLLVSLFAVINLFMLLCCRKDEDNWKCGSLVLTLLTFSGAIASLGAFIYTEVQFKNKWDDEDHGWSVIFGWIGACCLTIAFGLSFALICNGPDSDDYNKELVHSNFSRSNRGYEMN